MAPLFIQSNGASTGGGTAGSLSSSYSSNNGFDNFLVAVFRLPAGTAHTFTVFDTQGNSWINPLNFTNATERYQLWYAAGCKAGANTVTIQPDSSTFLRILIAEYSGVNSQSQSIADGTNSGIATSNSPNSGAVVTTNATDLLIGFTANQTADGVSFTPTSGFTVRRNVDGNLQLADLNTVATGSFSFTGTDGSSVQWGAGIAAFKASTTTSPYVGYGVNDCGGQALPSQEPASTIITAQTNAINQITNSGGRGPTNTGVFYQSGGGGHTPGTGQIFPSGRS